MILPDLPDSFEIQVTEREISEGEKSSNTLCPISLAAHRTVHGPLDFFYIKEHLQALCVVATDGVALYGKLYKLNNEVEEFTNNFDKGYPVKPFTTIIDILTEQEFLEQEIEQVKIRWEERKALCSEQKEDYEDYENNKKIGKQ